MHTYNTVHQTPDKQYKPLVAVDMHLTRPIDTNTSELKLVKEEKMCHNNIRSQASGTDIYVDDDVMMSQLPLPSQYRSTVLLVKSLT